MASTRQHAEWLSLIEVSGPFLTMPVLEKVFPQGLDAHDAELYRILRLAFEEWQESLDKPALHRAWIQFVLRQILEFPEEVLAEGQAIPETLKASVAEHGETLRPDLLVRNPAGAAEAAKARLLVQIYPAEQDLNASVEGRRWKASPATRMMELLHASEVRLGLVTNGEHWMMVYAPRGETTGYASWYAGLWTEEKLTLQAFRSLLGVRRFFGVPEDETPEAMLAESAKHQQEVTDQLGYQVRRAVEVLIHSLDRADQDHGRALLGRVPEGELYESALTVMMRLVFLFCAEERGLLLLGDQMYDQHYAVSTLVAQLQETADQHSEEVLERRRDAWVRLLTTFRVVFGGVAHDRMKLPAYGGRLFDPDRFPFLEGRAAGTKWRETPANPLPVNNRTVLHLLRSLQYLEMQGEARRLSFRALDIEQIGHVYEGLLDHTAKRATEPVLGLVGPRGNEPEIPLSKLEAARAKGDAELLKLLREETGKSETALQRLLDAELDTDESGRLRAACGNEAALFKRVLPFGALVRNDTFGRPVVIPKGSVYVTAGADRRSSGTHYTPRSLTEPIVQYTLEPLVYEGPAEGKPKEQWRLRSPRELLDLKICDMACGSGAFLVQACRYLSDRLVEAWEDIEKEQPGAPRITPEGAAATGALDEVLIPQETNERMSYAQRIVAQRCLYGVDKNPLAVEMAKLSLWLLTLAKYKPFTFIDHAIRSGDSLIGLHHLDQIKYFTLDLVNKQESYFSKEVQQVAAEVIELRKRIEARPVERVEDAEIKQRLLAEADAKTAQLGYAADLLLSVEFREINERQKEVWRRDMTLEAKMQLEQASLADFKAAAEKALNGQPTFHWPLEFPEVFALRGGFDAFIGNPPFMGGQLITGALGKKYRTYLINSIALGQTGSADLCSYFFLRISSLLKMNGSAGLIATNTISEGETRQVGLDQFSSYDTIIRAALATKHWPGAASIVVSLIWIIRGDWKGERLLNGSIVPAISSSLSHSSCTSANPLTLATQKKRAFKGSSLQGVGFLLSPDHALSIISQHPEYTKVLFPHLSGADVTSSPNAVPTRWAIKFFDWPLQKAEQFPICLDIVRAKVKPQREKAAGRNTIGARRAEFWWKYDAQARNLYDAIDGLPHVWVVAEHSKYAAIAKQPANISFNHTVVVFSTDSFEFFAAASSSIHLEWTRYYGGSLKTDISYSVADVFETFPFPTGVWPKPIEDPITLPYLTLLEMTGRSFYNKRQNIMIASNQGLTGVYNRFHNPEEPSDDIRRLRELHREMDETVAAAYGWTDLRLEHGFHETKQGMRFTISEGARREVLDRLLELNHKRYAEEVAAGLHEKGAKKGKQA